MRLIIDVGATKTLIVAVDKTGKELGRQRFPTDKDYPIFEGHLKDELDMLVAEHKDLEGIAMAMPGLVNYEKNTVTGFGNLAWKDVETADFLEKTYSVPVVMDNDANFGAIGESRRGAGKGYENVCYVTISTGIGTGITHSGSIDPMLTHSEAGSIQFWEDGHHTRWEKVASGKAFYEKYGRFGKDTPKSEVTIWRDYALQVAKGLHELIVIVQPDVIVVGGSMGEHLPKYSGYIMDYLNEWKTPVTLVPPVIQAKDFDGAVISGGIEALNDKLKL